MATSLNNVGFTFGALGKHEEALKYQMEALALSKKLLGDEHPNVAAILNNVGSTFGALGKHEEALKYLMEALKILNGIFKEDHPIVQEILKNIEIARLKLEASKDGRFTQRNIAIGSLLALAALTAGYFYSKSEK